MLDRYDRLRNAVRQLLQEAKADKSWENTAEELGISLKSLYRYLSGRCLPSLDTYEMLCEYVGCHCYPKGWR